MPVNLNVGHSSLLDLNGTTITTSKVQTGYDADNLITKISGHSVRLIQTFYVRAGVNDKLDFTRVVTSYTATLTPGTYSATELATEIVSAMEAQDGTSGEWSVQFESWALAPARKFRVENTVATFSFEWNTGANSATSIGNDIGADMSTDQSSSGSPARIDLTNEASHFGQWVKVDFGSLTPGAQTIEVYAYLKLYASLFGNMQGALNRDDLPDLVKVKHYTHGSDLGDDPRLWSASATLKADSDVTGSWTPNVAGDPPTENELGVQIHSTASASARWHYFLFHDDTGDLKNFPSMEIGYFAVYDELKVISDAAARTYAVDRGWTLRQPFKAVKANSSAQYGIARPPYWELNLPLEDWDPTSIDELLDVVRIVGRTVPAVWVFDTSDPNDGMTAWWAVIGKDINLDYTVNDWASHNLKLRQQR